MAESCERGLERGPGELFLSRGGGRWRLGLEILVEDELLAEDRLGLCNDTLEVGHSSECADAPSAPFRVGETS